MSFALVVCNGEPPAVDLLVSRCENADLIVAADGGILPLLEAGVMPDVLVGDLDSSFAPYPDGLHVVMDPDQETNDLEKALQLVLSRGLRNVLVLGATGLRLDQTLKNLSVLAQFQPHFDWIRFEDNLSVILIADKHTELSLPVGTDISLFPLSGRVEGIVTHGLMYSLNDEVLENGTRDGSSNVVVSSPISIRHTNGTLLLIIHQSAISNAWL